MLQNQAGELEKDRMLGPTPRISDLVSLGSGLDFACLSSQVMQMLLIPEQQCETHRHGVIQIYPPGIE